MEIDAERIRRVPSPPRIIEKCARKRDLIGMSIREDFFRLLGRNNHPDRARHNAGLLLDRIGKANLIARAN